MGSIAKPLKVKLVTGVIISPAISLSQVEKKLARAFGMVDFKSSAINFNFTNYYASEMGPDLKRYFLSFKKLVDPSCLPGVKLVANKLEAYMARGTRGFKRPVNIDPGYITDAKLILASTKDYSHRIYLARGIYAETTLVYQKNTFKPCSWTYPDYNTDDYIKVFNRIRAILMQQKKGGYEDRA